MHSRQPCPPPFQPKLLSSWKSVPNSNLPCNVKHNSNSESCERTSVGPKFSGWRRSGRSNKVLDSLVSRGIKRLEFERESRFQGKRRQYPARREVWLTRIGYNSHVPALMWCTCVCKRWSESLSSCPIGRPAKVQSCRNDKGMLFLAKHEIRWATQMSRTYTYWLYKRHVVKRAKQSWIDSSKKYISVWILTCVWSISWLKRFPWHLAPGLAQHKISIDTSSDSVSLLQEIVTKSNHWALTVTSATLNLLNKKSFAGLV